MIDNDQITTLAREYAEEKCGKETESPMYFGLAEGEMEEKLRWLSRRYCLVEKEAVRKEYNEAIRAVREGHRERLDTMIVVNNSRRVLLESLFSEIAKEVEG